MIFKLFGDAAASNKQRKTQSRNEKKTKRERLRKAVENGSSDKRNLCFVWKNERGFQKQKFSGAEEMEINKEIMFNFLAARQ